MLTFHEFIKERNSIRDKKNAGEPRPWTNDLVLHKTRFTNIDRNDDRGTLELFKKVKDFDIDSTVRIAVLFRTCYSSLLLLDRLTGVPRYDVELLDELRWGRITTRIPYNVWLYGGITMVEYLKTVAMPVAEYVVDHIRLWTNRSILSAGTEIGEVYGKYSPRRMFFVGTEIAKDLSTLYPNIIDPTSPCRLGPGAVKGLKLLQGETIKTLLTSTGLTYSALEHALCEYSKYVARTRCGRLKTAWLYDRR